MPETIYSVEIRIKGIVLAKDKETAAQQVLQNCFKTVPLTNILDHNIQMYAKETPTDIIKKLVIDPCIDPENYE